MCNIGCNFGSGCPSYGVAKRAVSLCRFPQSRFNFGLENMPHKIRSIEVLRYEKQIQNFTQFFFSMYLLQVESGHRLNPYFHAT